MSEGNTAPLARWDVGSCVFSVAASHDGTRIASGSGDNYVRVWDAHTGTLVLGPLQGHTGQVRSVAFSSDNTRILSSSVDHTIRIWDARTGTPIGEPLMGHVGAVYSVALSHDNTRIVSGSQDSTIRIWDSHAGTPIGEPLKGHTELVYPVAFSHDSTRIVSGSADATIRIWDALAGTLIGEPLKGHIATVWSVAFSHDSTRIVSGSSDETIRIWDTRTGTLIGEPLEGHTQLVWSVAFSHDSTKILSGSADCTVRIWDARSGTPLGAPLKGHTNRVYSVTFSHDSTRIFSGSGDKTICAWEVPQSAPSLDMVAPQDSRSIDMVPSKTFTQELFECLVKHGCTDFSSSIDPTRYSAIAADGFGDVLQTKTTSGTLVAVKRLRLHMIRKGGDQGMERTACELHRWSEARHENIQELLGIVMHKDRIGMVSLWMNNGNLRQYIEKNPSVDRYPLCVQIARGVAYLHGIGLLHGDLKALNVLVSADGVAKISDFDYSILAEGTIYFSETTRIGVGTVRWMAPELLLDQGEDGDGDSPPVMRNKQTDVYALGMTVLETISGKIPYHQIPYDAGVIRALIQKKLPTRPEELSGPEARTKLIWALLLTCWDHSPSARPDASFVLGCLQAFVA